MATKTIELPIKGMTCSSCSRYVEKQVENIGGVVSMVVNHRTNTGEFVIDEKRLSKTQLIGIINQGHYKVDLTDVSDINSKPDSTFFCPKCGVIGLEVPSTVLRSNLKAAAYKRTDLVDKFLICMSSTCDIAYYTTEKRQLIGLRELKRELYFKQGSTKQIVCYCNNIDVFQIESALKDRRSTKWEDVMGYYRSKVIEKCEVLNPSGLCCRPYFDEVVSNFTSH